MNKTVRADLLNYNLVRKWNGGFKSELFFSPKDESIEDWRITFEANFDIRGIWGAKILNRSGELYTLVPDEDKLFESDRDYKITIVADTDNGDTSDVKNLQFNSSALTVTPTLIQQPIVKPLISNNDLNSSQGQFEYGEVIQKSFLFYEAQRSGDLPNDNRIQWRGDSSLDDGSDVGRDLSGGYHDAGDHVKFGLPMSQSMATLAWGGIEYKNAYLQMSQWDELLDTVKWGTDWILKAHHNPGGVTKEVYVQVGDGDLDHSYWAAPEEMTMARPAMKVDTNNPGTDISADYAATLASASILFRGENNSYANRLLTEAKQLYSFAEQYKGKYSDSVAGVNPYYTSWNGYGDELIWGATWLHKATGEQKYLDKAQEYAQQYGIDPGNSALSWDGKNPGSLVLLAQTGDNYFKNIAEDYLDRWLPGGSTPTYTPGGLAWNGKWASLRASANTAFLTGVYHDTVENKSEYHDFTKQQIDYILGDNPRNSSYVVGFGNNSPKNPHHRAASGDALAGEDNEHILYGAMVAGPKSANDFDWQDDRSDYVGNEVALDYNAGFTGASAHMYAKYGGAPLSENELDNLIGIEVKPHPE